MPRPILNIIQVNLVQFFSEEKKTGNIQLKDVQGCNTTLFDNGCNT